MNAVVPFVTSAPIAPAQGCLVPASMTEAMKLAEMVAKTNLVPKSFRGSAPNCLMVIMQAVRWQMDPFAVIQECSVIQDKIMYSGKLTAAVINTNGNLEDRLSYDYEGEGDDYAIIVSGRLRGEEEPRTAKVRLKEARTNNAAWQKQPDQQLVYHGARVWARRHMPELMLGVWTPEEFEEGKVAAAAPAVTDASPIQPAAEPPLAHDPVTGEVGPRAIALPEAETEWRAYGAWASQFMKQVEFSTSLDEIDQWRDINKDMILTLKNKFPKILDRITTTVTAAREKLTKAAPPAKDDDGIPSFLDRRKQEPPSPEQPEDYLEYLSTTLKACQTEDGLDETWNDEFQPRLADMFPPDAAIAIRTYEDCKTALKEATT